MSEAMIATIADEANMIIAGYSYTFNDKGYITMFELWSRYSKHGFFGENK